MTFGFMKFYKQQSSGRKQKEMNKSKIQSKTVGIVQKSLHVLVWVIVAYYCVWMCKWLVYVKIHAQHDKLGVVYWMRERSCREHCYSRDKTKFFISICVGDDN